MMAGLLVTSPRNIASAISRGEAKPLHLVKVARHRRGDRGEPWCTTPPRGLANTTVIPCHFLNRKGKIPSPPRGLGLGGEEAPRRPGGQVPRGV